MSEAALALLAGVWLASCGGKEPAPAPPANALAVPPDAPPDAPPSPELARMIELRDRMCACQDLACGQQVDSELQAWRHESDRRPRPVLSEAQREALSTLYLDVGECYAKLPVP